MGQARLTPEADGLDDNGRIGRLPQHTASSANIQVHWLAPEESVSKSCWNERKGGVITSTTK